MAKSKLALREMKVQSNHDTFFLYIREYNVIVYFSYNVFLISFRCKLLHIYYINIEKTFE